MPRSAIRHAALHGALFSQALLAWAFALAAGAAPLSRFEAAPHHYWEAPLQNPFTEWLKKTQGQPAADSPAPADEKEALRRLLASLKVPESSQMLVFSATSLQRSISPSRPRALYFNDELYVGWVPGGSVEIAADDPSLGPVFFIANFTRSGALTTPERQNRCMNCHASSDLKSLPSLMAASTLPDVAGGSLESWRDVSVGHQVPWSERFGGWHVTDAPASAAPHSNLLGEYSQGRIQTLPNPPGQRYRESTYLRPSSNVLPQLVHEHQLGAVNLLTAALYRARELKAAASSPAGSLSDEARAELATLGQGLARYFLFADEAAAPASGIPQDDAFARSFSENKKTDARGRSLKDFDLTTRLFRHRGSYMIYTPLWRHLPPEVKDPAWRALHDALSQPGHPNGLHLPAEEKTAIQEILTATCDDLPAWWKES